MQPGVTDSPVPRWRGIFCNRTLNLRSIRAVGYDMDYTLIHYKVAAWEQAAFEFSRRKLEVLGWPLQDAEFDPSSIIRGLVLDRELGNIVKANRFGYIKGAAHGTRMLDYGEQRRVYARTAVDLTEDRFVFLNTLFALSEAAIYLNMVDLLDAGRAPEGLGVIGYAELYSIVRRSVDETHVEGELKAQILADPERYIELDPEAPLTLLDQRHAGKKVLLITNSGWTYTRGVMEYAFDPFLPDGMTWQDLFDIKIVGARKPLFFEYANPAYEVVDDEGLLRPFHSGILEDGKTYLGGHADMVEQSLDLLGEQILYIGDHAFGDARSSKSTRRWRTALILRELESELHALEAFDDQQREFTSLMGSKSALEARSATLRLELQRLRVGYGPEPSKDLAGIESALADLRVRIQDFDARIAPLAETSAQLANSRWGLLMRTGNDKSMMARHVERHSDIYTSRISNLLYATPFQYLRSNRGSLPHDPP